MRVEIETSGAEVVAAVKGEAADIVDALVYVRVDLKLDNIDIYVRIFSNHNKNSFENDGPLA